VTRVHQEDGVAITMAVMAVLLISAAGAALLLLASSETIIAAHFRSSVLAQYGVEAMMVRGIDLVAALDDWAGPIAGSAKSALLDGALIGGRTLQDGSTLDLVQVVNLANCQKPTTCSLSDLAAVTVDRPWGANNPRWQPYAYGSLSSVLAASSPLDSPYYVLLLVADDPTGTHRPRATGAPAPTREGIALRAEAFGPRGAHAVIEVIASRTIGAPAEQTDYNLAAGSPMKILSWREVR
jgi:hypothetical protein